MRTGCACRGEGRRRTTMLSTARATGSQRRMNARRASRASLCASSFAGASMFSAAAIFASFFGLCAVTDASYTAHTLRSTNCTNIGARLLPGLSGSTARVLALKCQSPQRKRRSCRRGMPRLSACRPANWLKENAHPSHALAKTTLPRSGLKNTSASRRSSMSTMASTATAPAAPADPAPFSISSSSSSSSPPAGAAKRAEANTSAVNRLDMTTFTCSRMRVMWWYASMGDNWSSVMSLSTLLSTSTGRTPSSHACRNTACV
mmetsp:Transcript_23305/g.75060  ORF Transcript_23305/g.75060 Transcript_23305/m.75060 type:complete len:262 (+) Transcript_23305:316-1101(+)